MLQSDLERVILTINRKLDEGVTIFIKDHRKGDAIINGLVSGVTFMVSSIAIQEIRSAYIRRKNKKWFEANKGQ